MPKINKRIVLKSTDFQIAGSQNAQEMYKFRIELKTVDY